MPYTPIHLSIAYMARAIKPRLSLPALIVSTMTPDLEIPLLYVITGGQHSRLILHGLLGAATLGTTLSVLITVFVYSPVVSFLFKLDNKTVEERCRLSWNIVALCLFGSLSHVLIDALHHEYNPLLFPFTYDSFNALVLMNDYKLASVIIPVSFLSLLIFFVAKEVGKGTKNLWKRLLVE